MTRTHRLMITLSIAATLSPAAFLFAVNPVQSPPAATTPPLERDEQSIITDLRAENEQLKAVMPTLPVIANADFRKQNATKLAPIVHKMSDLFAELSASQSETPTRAKIDADRFLYLSILVALDDTDAVTTLKSQADGPTPNAIPAQSALTLGTWWRDSRDSAAQSRLLADYTAIAKANPTNDRIAITLSSMANLGASSPDLSKAALDCLRTTQTGSLAKQILARADGDQAGKDMVGKPLTVAGRTTTSGAFSSDTFKGKVVLIDFWATWCGPCNTEIPRVKELYANFHAKGLEIVGVDCDDADDTVNNFIKQHDMTWLQLRETSQAQEQWHPLAKQWHVNGIPTMFLLDRKGVLRYIDAREDTQVKVQQLLAEAAE